MSSSALSAHDLLRLQAEGLEPAPADWLESQRWQARSGEQLDALDDPVKAARRFKRAVAQEAEDERRYRYFRGMPPIEADLAILRSAPQSPSANDAEPATKPASELPVEDSPERATPKVRIRTRSRPTVASHPVEEAKTQNVEVSRTNALNNTSDNMSVGEPAMPALVPLKVAASRQASAPKRPAPGDKGIRGLNENGASPAPQLKCAKGEYDVGYCKPPVHTRFQPAQSGNPKGRPKGAKNTRTLALEILMRKRPANIQGKKTNITGHRGIFEKQLHKALDGGDLKSSIFILNAAGMLPGSGKANDVEASKSVAPPLTDAEKDILTFYRRELLEKAGVDPALIESILKGESSPSPPE